MVGARTQDKRAGIVTVVSRVEARVAPLRVVEEEQVMERLQVEEEVQEEVQMEEEEQVEEEVAKIVMECLMIMIKRKRTSRRMKARRRLTVVEEAQCLAQQM